MKGNFMAKPVVYVETSVVSYYTARPSHDVVTLGHQETTRQWWPRAKKQFELVVSDVVFQEIEEDRGADFDEQLQAVEGLRRLPLSPECEKVAKQYLSELPWPQRDDRAAAHLAIACVHRVEYVVTWKRRQLGSVLICRELDRINQRLALSTPIICTPQTLPPKGMPEDPIVKEVREARKKLFEEAGGTMEGLFEMLRREEAKDKRPVFRRRAPHAPKKGKK